MTDNYQILRNRLDAFIRRYYKNLCLRGLIYALMSAAILFLVITTIEYFAYLSSALRAVLFFFFIAFNAYVLVRFIAIPFFKIYKLGRIISDEEAARIIGTHFTAIGDKLLNVLQLRHMADNNPAVRQLIEAGINQKAEAIKPFQFKEAVNFRDNLRYMRYAMIPLLIIGMVFLAIPSVFTDATRRIVNYDVFYEKEAPFSINITNEELKAVQNEDFTLDVRLSGSEIPADVYIESGSSRYLLQRKSNTQRYYTFRNVQRSTTFRFAAAGFTTAEYTLNVMPRPMILSFDAALAYPPYLGKKDEKISNTGDLNIPAGTTVTWYFTTRDTRTVNLRFADENNGAVQSRPGYFSLSRTFKASTSYTIVTGNEFIFPGDSINYTINVTPDAFPEIEAEEYRDSVLDYNIYFKGTIKDDYGFRKLTFNYSVLSGNNQSPLHTIAVPLNNNMTVQQFFHYFNVALADHKPGDIIEYYFEVWDNDGVNGSKSTRSRTMMYKTLSEKELREETDNKAEQLSQTMESALKNAQNIQKSIDELNKRLLDKKSLNWQDKQLIEQLLQQNLELQKQTEDIQKSFENKEEWEKQFNQPNEELLRKQEEINKLLEQLMTEEMKELLKELQEKMDELDKDKVKEMLDKMKMDTKDVEKELDRSMELLKQFELEKKLSETIEKLDKLSEEQKELSEKSEDKNADAEKLQEEQQKLNEKFDEVKKALDDIDKKNKELEQPNNLSRTDEEQQKIGEEMQNSSEQLQKKNTKKASQSQKNASEQMQQLSEKLQEMEAEMQEENLAEDIDNLRSILENLLRTSFTQEELMLTLAKTRTNDPRYVALMQEQNKIRDDLKMIEDSLFALSKRQTQIESFVNAEIADINSNLGKAVEALVARNPGESGNRQQFVMTHINNLALMLNEAMQNMQNQMAQSQSGKCKNSCNKPGGSQQSFKSLRQMQEALNKMMQDMKDGKKPGGQSGQQSLSEQMARMAAQQEAIRNYLKALSEQLKKEGQGNSKEMENLQKQMEQTETDLVNKMLSPETLRRQQDILTRLLEHEKAEKEREMEEQRESNEAKNQKYSNPIEFFKYNNLKSKEEELLKTVPPSFRNFYKNKVNEYFHNFQESYDVR